MPHVCGDEPGGGWTKMSQEKVCPTYVGMNRIPAFHIASVIRMPHACGDEPLKLVMASRIRRYAPRMWG